MMTFTEQFRTQSYIRQCGIVRRKYFQKNILCKIPRINGVTNALAILELIYILLIQIQFYQVSDTFRPKIVAVYGPQLHACLMTLVKIL